MIFSRTASVCAAFVLLSLPACAQTVEGRASAPKPERPKQSAAASKTVKFASIAKTSPVYKTALDAHALDKAAKMIGKPGAFRGKVSKVFERGGIIIFDFDPDYKTAVTAALRGSDFAKFPNVKTLEGKEVVVTGKFEEYRGKTEIVLTKPEQVKLVK